VPLPRKGGKGERRLAPSPTWRLETAMGNSWSYEKECQKSSEGGAIHLMLGFSRKLEPNTTHNRPIHLRGTVPLTNQKGHKRAKKKSSHPEEKRE